VSEKPTCYLVGGSDYSSMVYVTTFAVSMRAKTEKVTERTKYIP